MVESEDFPMRRNLLEDNSHLWKEDYNNTEYNLHLEFTNLKSKKKKQTAIYKQKFHLGVTREKNVCVCMYV